MRPPIRKEGDFMRIARAGLLTKILILLLLIAAAVSLLTLNDRVEKATAENQELARQVALQTQINADLADAIDHSDDLDRIADVARDKLGLVMPGEIIFYSMGD